MNVLLGVMPHYRSASCDGHRRIPNNVTSISNRDLPIELPLQWVDGISVTAGLKMSSIWRARVSRTHQDRHNGSSLHARWCSDNALMGGGVSRGTGGGAGMADVFYVLLLIGIFVVLAGALRGLERL